MKKYFLTIYPFLLWVIFTGCKKLLEEKPKSLVVPSTYFTNAANFESAVKGVYGISPIGDSYMSEMFSDIYASPSGSAEQALPVYQNVMSEAFYCVRGSWSGPYSTIKDANFVLSNLPSTILTDALNSQYAAECRFFRAYAYFRLVQFFGPVPLRTTPLTDYSNLQLARTSEDSIYNQILEDLNYAEANLPADATQEGRVYKLAATALLAKVYLTMAGNPLNKKEYYQNAKDKALAVIASPKFALLDDYASVFHNTRYTTESIWEQLYTPGTGNGLHASCLTQKGFVPILLPDPAFISSFSPGDRRRSWGINSTFYDTINKVVLPSFFAKFVDTSYINDRTKGPGSGVSYTISFLRLAEMYLVAAESENEINGPANAYQYINKIRWRAREDKNNPSQVPDLTGLSQTQLRDSIILERKHELHLEGHTWFDMKRTNTLNKIQLQRSAQLSVPIGDYNQRWLIPDVELSINTIPQNPRP